MQQIALLVAVPLLGAFLLPSLARVHLLLARWGVPLLLLGLLLWTVPLLQQVESGAVAIAIGHFAAPLGISFYVDQLALWLVILLLAVTLLIWPVFKSKVHQQSLLLILIGSACGIILSGDIFNIYVFYELLSVASFGLVVERRSGAAYAATLRYLVVSSVGTVLALAGIALIYNATGTLNLADLARLESSDWDRTKAIAAFTLLILGFGVKAELFPLNQWVPEVYGAASSRIAALMAGVISKVALLIIIRLVVLLFPYPEVHQLLMVLAIAGVLFGELAAWQSRDFTRLLAYSSMGQLGLVFMALAIPGEAGVLAAVALALHHLLIKPALFLLAESWGRSLSQLRGLWYTQPLKVALFILLILSLLGVPPLPGFWAKWLLLSGLASLDGSLAAMALAVVAVATVVEVSYLFNLVRILVDEREQTVQDVPLTLPHSRVTGVLLSLAALILVAASFNIAAVGQHLQQIVQQAGDRQHYIAVVKPEIKP